MKTGASVSGFTKTTNKQSEYDIWKKVFIDYWLRCGYSLAYYTTNEGEWN